MARFLSHTHDQVVPATEWTMQHNLGTLAPIVDVYVTIDGNQTKILPASVEVLDANSVKVTFSNPRAGSAGVR